MTARGGLRASMVRACTGEVCVRHEHLFGDIQGILHVPGGVFGRHVQGFKIVVVDFHFRAGSHVKAQTLKNLADFFRHQGGGMQAAAPGRATGNGRIETAQGFGLAPSLKSGLTGLEQGSCSVL